MSPALLSQRLKMLEHASVVSRVKVPREPGVYAYELTTAGRDLQHLIEGFGVWGQRWIESKLTLQNVDPKLLMWDMRRNLDPTPMPHKRCNIHFVYPEANASVRSWWLLIQPDRNVDLCSVDPGVEIDLQVRTDLRTMTAIWMGLLTVRSAIRERKMTLLGDEKLASKMQVWLGLSPFAKEKKLVA